MKFENPIILYLLLLLIVPIIIHLFNLRKYQNIFFSNLFVLKTIKQETRKKREIKKWLILFCRLLLISTLIISFAKPYLKSKNISKKANFFSIYIDNSLSMDILNPQTNKSLIQEAKDIALDIVNSLDEGQKINIITNNYSYNNQNFQSKEKVIKIINNITTSPFNTNICNILERQKNLTEGRKSIYKFIISDFDKNFIKNSKCNISEEEKLETIHLTSIYENNISINHCVFEQPFHKKGEKSTMMIEFENHGKEDLDSIQFRLYINDKTRGVFSMNISNNSIEKKYIDIINTEDGHMFGKIELLHEDSYIFDNTLFFSYEIKKKIKILSIYEESPTEEIFAVFNDPVFELKQYNKNQIQISELKKYDLIILDHLVQIPSGFDFNLNKILEKEHNVLILPSEKLNLKSYNSFFDSYSIDNLLEWRDKEIKTNFINTNHWIFSNVFEDIEENIDLPIINGYFKTENQNLTKSRNNILKLLNNDLLLAEYTRKGGSIFLCTSPLNSNYNNFTNHAIFLPIMHNICRNNNTEKLYHTIEKNLEIKLSNVFSEIDIPIIKYFEEKKEKISFFPDLKTTKNNNYLKLNNDILKSGNYHIFSKNRSETNFRKYLSLNYQRNEGDFKSDVNHKKNLASLNLDLNNFDKQNIIEKKPIDLTFYLIIISIFLFLTELLLLKFWKQ